MLRVPLEFPTGDVDVATLPAGSWVLRLGGSPLLISMITPSTSTAENGLLLQLYIPILISSYAYELDVDQLYCPSSIRPGNQ